MDNTRSSQWDDHYSRKKSVLQYPDENLVRMLKSYISPGEKEMTAIDLGCGSGRHIALLIELGITNTAGMDYSMNAMEICRMIGPARLVLGDNSAIPVKSDMFDIAVTWGSLHYSAKESLGPMLNEMRRIIKKGGRLFGTLRSSGDSYMKRGRHLGNDTWITDLNDIKKSIVSFYSEEELRSALSIFSRFEYGIMERSRIGDTGKIISHWFFWAEK
jgi:ubiquinone/menaquinone biosynthesis C-methylase UbiE